MFCSTVSSGIRLKLWKIKPMFRRRNTVRLRSFIEKISLPSMNTFPEVGVSSAPIMFSSVLLPEPDSPTIATNSPFGTEKVACFKASTVASPVPYVLEIFLTSNKFISDYTSFCLGIERVARQPYCIMTGTLPFCRNQKVDRKGYSNPKCAIHLNRSIVCFYNGLCQRQAQPDPLRIF